MPAEPTVAVLTLGCKLNQADSEAIARRLAGAGVRVVDRPARGAHAFVINTCSVTHVADRKARRLVRLARRLSPGAEVILTGCYAETAGVAESAGADAVVGNADKQSIADRLLPQLQQRGDPAGGCATPVRGGLRTRAFVKIQEGCNELCAFCIVPYTRGREQSVPVEQVVREAQARESEGVIEVVLTGTQLGNYGRDLGWSDSGPRALLEALLDCTSLPRIRLSSLQAQNISPELVRLWPASGGRLCPHFHLPLQSGSDDVLSRMRRRYTVQQYMRAAELIRESIPDVAITTDVIAGFPGETEQNFEATYRLCEEIGFAAIHAFPYSRRPNTPASLMKEHLPPEVRRRRLERLLELGERSSRAYRERFLGSTLDVLWEDRRGGQWQGLTGNYIRVYTSAGAALSNRLLPTRLVASTPDGMTGMTDFSEGR